MAYIWEWFEELNPPGGLGWGSYVVPFYEIEAYGRSIGQHIKHWEALLIRNLCFEVMVANKEKADKERPPTPGAGPQLKNVVPMSDGKGLLSLFRRK